MNNPLEAAQTDLTARRTRLDAPPGPNWRRSSRPSRPNSTRCTMPTRPLVETLINTERTFTAVSATLAG